MSRSDGNPIAHKAGGQRFVATLAGVDVDCRLCVAVVAAVCLALTESNQLEVLVAALTLFLLALRATASAETFKGRSKQEPRVAPSQHRCGGDGRSPWAGNAANVADDSSRSTLYRIRGRDLRPSTVSPAANRQACKKYVNLIMGFAREREWEKALEVLATMRRLSIEPNVVCFTSLINACDRGNQPEKALELFDAMQTEGIEPDVVTYNAVISACSNGQMPERAQEKCTEMQERGLAPNVVTWTSLICAWGQSRHPQRAWEVFAAMKEAGMKPNVITFSSLIQTASKCGDPERGLRIYAEMEEAGIAPSTYAYNNLRCCWRGQPLSRALAAIRTMKDEGRPPSGAACSAVTRVCDLGVPLESPGSTPLGGRNGLISHHPVSRNRRDQLPQGKFFARKV